MDSKSDNWQPTIVLSLANIFFHIVHLAIIFFFLFGWLSGRTLAAHLILALLILFSWCGLGVFRGFGYCLVTDIQWRIKKLMGEAPSTEYYIKYMLDKVTGYDLNPVIVNYVTTYSFFIILALSTTLFIGSLI